MIKQIWGSFMRSILLCIIFCVLILSLYGCFMNRNIDPEITVIRSEFLSEENGSVVTLYMCISEDGKQIDGLNIDVLSEVIDFRKIISEERFEVCGYPCGIFHGEGISYACWTTSLEASGIMEYDPSYVSREQVVKVIESVYKQSEP